MDKVIVTGACGHIGNVLIRKLYENNRQIVAVCMPGEDTTPLEGLKIEIVYGDITDKKFVQNLITSGSTVFHLAGIIDIGAGKYETVYNVNVNGTKNIVDACIENKSKKLIYTSTVHIIDPKNQGDLLEEPTSFEESKLVGSYAKTKAISTKYVLDKCKEGVLNATIVYPAGVIGPYDYKISEIGQVVLDYMNKKLLAYVKGGYNFVDVRDVADGIIQAELKGRSGEGYLLSGTPTTLKQLLQAINNVIGRKNMPPKIALWFVRMFASVSNLYYKVRKKKPVFSAYSLYTLNSNCNFSNQKAKSELGFNPRPVEESIKDAVNWFIDNKPELVKLKKNK